MRVYGDTRLKDLSIIERIKTRENFLSARRAVKPIKREVLRGLIPYDPLGIVSLLILYES